MPSACSGDMYSGVPIIIPVRVIPPPVEMPAPPGQAVAAFRKKWALNGHHVIGFAARLATEKGVEVLLQALLQAVQFGTLTVEDSCPLEGIGR